MRTFTEFFGFCQDPFKRTPDVEFYYPTKMHIDALDTLQYLIHSDEPFAILTGEPGTGKTITIKKFINELPTNIVSAYILFPNLTPEELFLAILEDFDIEVDKALTKNALFAKLRDFLIDIGSKGKKAVIIIDEAQNLPNETLEELRILSNLETEKDKLLKIILAGQPELDEKLNEESLRQLKQRVTLYVSLDNIKQEDIKDYIYSHIEKAGKSYVKIQNGVVRKIAKITKGNPRLINTLMERTMVAAFLNESHTITENHLMSALASVNNVMITVHKKQIHKKPKQFVAIGVIAVLALLVGFLAMDKIFNLFGKESSVAMQQVSANKQTDNLQANNNQQVNAQQVNDSQQVASNEQVISNEQANEINSSNYINSDSQQNNNELNSNNQHGSMTVAQNITTDTQNTSNNINNNNQNINNTVNNSNVSNQVIPYINQAENQLKDVYILANSLNVRAIPSLESARVYAVKVGQRYDYVSENNDWVEIRISPTLTGWVFKQYVSISDKP